MDFILRIQRILKELIDDFKKIFIWKYWFYI